MVATENKNESSHIQTERSSSGAPASGHAVRDFFSTDEIFKRVAASAEEEFERSTRLLFFSGLAAGLSIGLSFMARAAITAKIPYEAADLIANLFYPIGFLLIVMGRYQLFTENTLTPVTLVLTRLASVPSLLRNWGVVLAANLAGALLVGLALATTDIFEPAAADFALDLGKHALETDWFALLFKAIVAGWLVASMVWLIHAARDSITRFFMIIFIMYLIPSMDLYHCIIGACEVFYVAFRGEANIVKAFFTFVVPVIIGNTIGGVMLVAILNYAQTSNSRASNADCGQLELTVREWAFEFHDGRVEAYGAEHPTKLSEPVSERDHMSGNPDAPFQLLTYGDYECEQSKQIYQLAQELEEKHDISFVYRYLPLSQRYKKTIQAVKAVEAADKQGKFWQMHRELFQNQAYLDEKYLMTYAEEIGLDMDRFESDMHSAQAEDRIQYDRRTAVQSNVRTPNNLFINGERYQGAWTVEGIVNYIESLDSTV